PRLGKTAPIVPSGPAAGYLYGCTDLRTCGENRTASTVLVVRTCVLRTSIPAVPCGDLAASCEIVPPRRRTWLERTQQKLADVVAATLTTRPAAGCLSQASPGRPRARPLTTTRSHRHIDSFGLPEKALRLSFSSQPGWGPCVASAPKRPRLRAQLFPISLTPRRLAGSPAAIWYDHHASTQATDPL